MSVAQVAKAGEVRAAAAGRAYVIAQLHVRIAELEAAVQESKQREAWTHVLLACDIHCILSS